MIPTLKLLHDRCVEEGDCLIWQQACNSTGHPIITLSSRERSRSVRRIVYELHNGPIRSGYFVYATCGLPTCIAKAHLRSGPKSQYMQLAAKRGAYDNPVRDAKLRRIRRASAKYSLEQARAIRSEVYAGETIAAAGRKHGVGMFSAWAIVHNRHWREPDTLQESVLQRT